MTASPFLAADAVALGLPRHTAVWRAGVLLRISDDRSGEGRSNTEQNTANNAVCAREGWDVAATYTDTMSASRFARGVRVDYVRAMDDVNAGMLDVLVMWECSRGGRELEEWARLLNACRANNVGIYVTSHRRLYDVRIARDWRTLAEDGVDSAYESEKISIRALRAAKAGALAGRPHGRCPYGYERVYNPVTRGLVEQRPHAVHAPVVREIVHRLYAGEAIKTVMDDLNARGIPSPKGGQWSRSSVRATATNPLYISRRFYQGEWLDGTWPALVPVDEHYGVVLGLADPTRRTTKPGKAKWMLSYLATSQVCGGELRGGKSRPNSKHGIYACADGCTSIRSDWLDGAVAEAFAFLLSEPGVYERIMRTDDAGAVTARAEAAALQARLDEFRDAAADVDGPSPAALARIEAKLTPQIEAALKRANNAATPGVLRDLMGDHPDPTYDQIRDRFDACTVAQQKEAIRKWATVTVGKAVERDQRRRGVMDAERVRVAPID